MLPGFSPDEPLTIDDLFTEYEAPLQRYAWSLVHDADRVDDLVQETMIRAIGNIWLLGRMNPWQRRSWLCKVLKNRFIDEERTRIRQAKLMEYLVDQDPVIKTPSYVENLSSILEQVPELYRSVLQEHYLTGKSTGEIANELDISSATVRSRLFLARKWLREHRRELL